jgi:hypothetical protein
MQALDYGLIATVVAAVLGAAKGVEAYAKRRADSQAATDLRAVTMPPGANVDTTSELARPVTHNECARTRGELSQKVEGLDDKVDALNVTLIRLEGKVDAWAAKTPGDTHSIARKELDQHERRMHGTATGSYRRSRHSDSEP